MICKYEFLYEVLTDKPKCNALGFGASKACGNPTGLFDCITLRESYGYLIV